jgi:TPR repeat protein
VNGIGTEVDLLAAKIWYFRAAERKDSKAYFSLGEINEMQGDEARARDWYRKAAKAGDSDAALRLARLILEKASSKRQIASALKWLSLAESLGNARARRFAKSKKVSAARRRLDSSI